MALEEFVNYYKPILNFDDSEWNTFLSCMSTKLPSALRITPSPLQDKIKQKLTLQPNAFFENVYDAVHKGAQDRDLIVNSTNVGFIQRQEVVSMLPVILMDLKPHHSVLDMCAAPGSKTKQLLEIAKLVVANDCNAKRLNVLVTETTKIPHSSFLVLKHDASALPVFKTDFDRVLCDVPCSGDGTSRKNPTILSRWTSGGAEGLHSLQLRILKHAFKFVKEGGLVVYSTCSLNPIENEMVVQKAVEEEDLEIVDLREQILNGFIVREGLGDGEFKKCIRVYPHDNNTGGFFITGLRKKSKTNLLTTKKPYTNFHIIKDELRSQLSIDYDVRDKIIIHKDNSLNTLYEVSQEVLDIISNNRLNVIYCGYKIFEKCALTDSKYRMKNMHALANLEVSGEEVIKSKSFYENYKSGPVVVRLVDFNLNVGGYSYGNKINLYISNNLQKALLDFYKIN